MYFKNCDRAKYLCVYCNTQTCSIPDVLPLVEFVLEDGIRYDILGDLTLTLIVK